MFPSPLEVNGVSNFPFATKDGILSEFPSPLEVTGGSNLILTLSLVDSLCHFRPLSR